MYPLDSPQGQRACERAGRAWYARGLLDQILADPDDDALRLVYADQLLAAGDARGEYIAVEARLDAAPRGSHARAELARRRVALREAHGAAWWPELPERRIGTRYGFAETVALYPIELELLPRLASREPIRTLELLEYRRGAWLSRSPGPNQVRRLVVHSQRDESLNSGELQDLWQSPLCDEIEELVVACWSAAGWLPAGAQLTRCRRLCLAGADLATGSFESPLDALRRWTRHMHLEVLDVSHCRGMSVVGVAALMSLRLPALRVLRMSGNPVGDEGARMLASYVRELPALERLELLDAGISARGAAMLRAAGAGVEMVFEAPPPARLAIDAFGIDLELIRVHESGWAVEIDGTRRPLRILRGSGQRAAQLAPLGPVVRALSTGAPRQLASEVICVSIGPDDEARLGIAIDRSELWYEPPGASARPDL